MTILKLVRLHLSTERHPLCIEQQQDQAFKTDTICLTKYLAKWVRHLRYVDCLATTYVYVDSEINNDFFHYLLQSEYLTNA